MGLFDRKKEGSKWDAWIGEKIRAAREEKGWTQWELAKEVYKSQTNISDYERGRLEISVVDLMYIALALEKPLTYFTPPKFNGATPNDLSVLDKVLFEQVSKIPEEMELALIEQAKTYAKISQRAEDQKAKAELALRRADYLQQKKAKKAQGKR